MFLLHARVRGGGNGREAVNLGQRSRRQRARAARLRRSRRPLPRQKPPSLRQAAAPAGSNAGLLVRLPGGLLPAPAAPPGPAGTPGSAPPPWPPC
jgi:hypothetical protein